MRVQIQLIGLLVALGAGLRFASGLIRVNTPKELENLFKYGTDPEGTDDKLDLLDLFLEDILPTWLGQAPNNQNGTLAQYKQYNLMDESNDDAFDLTAQQLITRSGFRYELYDAVSEDGYVTQITRIINPLVDPSRLRRPPVLIEHGGQIDITAYMIASSIQHFPEKWPRTPEDEGHARSSNRSLAFYLANQGFDVWLAETRGSSDTNMRHVTSRLAKNKLQGTSDERNQTVGEQFKKLVQQWNYWAFTQDDIIAYEYKSHIDTVRQMSGSDKLHVITYSLSTPISLAFFSQRPEYAEKVVGFVSIAPIVSGQGVSLPIKFLLQNLCALLPDELGTLVVTRTLFTQPFRELLRLIASNKYIRYSLVKAVLGLLLGPSPKWRTLIDLNVVGHLLRKVSFREVKQMCQQMRANKLQKFDYGPVKNQLIYNSPEPPVYDLSNLNLKNWIIIAAENDALSTPGVVRHLISIANPKPVALINIPNFNHADLVAGWENDIYVNQPIKKYLEEAADMRADQRASGARNLDLVSFFQDLLPTKVVEHKSTTTTGDGHPLTLPNIYLDAMQKGMNEFFDALTKEFGNLLRTQLTQGPNVATGAGKAATKALVKGATNVAGSGAAAAAATAAAATSALTDAAGTSTKAGANESKNPLAKIPLLGAGLGDLGGLGQLGNLLGGGGIGTGTGGSGGDATTYGANSPMGKLSKVAETTKVIGQVAHIAEDIDHLIHPEHKSGASKEPLGNLFSALTGGQ